MVVQIGKAGFNLAQLKQSGITTKKAFEEAFAGKIGVDIDKAWKQVSKELKKFKD
ncbi:MAG: hypothetical protein NZ604_06670 [Flavobacteriales bacterium]|nr:hypothetical protein [Flavobacteriales bacterium]